MGCKRLEVPLLSMDAATVTSDERHLSTGRAFWKPRARDRAQRERTNDEAQAATVLACGARPPAAVCACCKAPTASLGALTIIQVIS